MIYELRTYHTLPGRMPALLKRFETRTLKIWERMGIRQLGFWRTTVGPSHLELVYILVWDSLAERERINFAFVWLYGLLVHRTLRLNVIQGHTASDKVFEEETIRNFRQLIERAVSHWGAVRTKA